MKRVIVAILFAFLFLPNFVFSQDAMPNVRLKFDTRFDYTVKVPVQDTLSTLSSFDGKYLNIILDGDINEKFSYNYRQRMILDGKPGYQNFFNATDWLYLTYKIDKNFFVSGGKQVIAIGGFEYDAAPIDLYFWSDFWNNVTCYQIGGTVGYKTTDEQHTIAFQVTNSPFTTHSLQGIYAYNLIWHGNFNRLSTIHSYNRIEFEKGQYINYLTLGHKFNLRDFSLELDLMDRFSDKQKNLLADYSIIGDVKYNVNNKISAFVKVGYDENHAQKPDELFVYDRYVEPGTEYFFYGAGIEYFPISNSKDIRIHAFWASNNDPLQYNTFNVGARWQMNVLKKQLY